MQALRWAVVLLLIWGCGERPKLERLPGAAGIKVFMGSSTGDLLVEDDEGVASILGRTRRRAAFAA